MAAEIPRNDEKGEEEEEEEEEDSLSHKKSIYPSLYYHVDYPLSEREALASLISKEIDNKQHFPSSRLIQNDPFLAGARRESVVWILKANTHHSFSASTAVVAVNYFDSLINTHMFEKNPPWVPKLAAVACLSLAAKMVEDRFPGLSDFHVEDESRGMFDAKSIKKMELLILSKLEWKMNPVTPISFLSCLAKRLESSNNKEENHRLSNEFLQESVDVLFSIITDWRIMGYASSIMASAIASFVNPTLFGRNKTISPLDNEPTALRLLQFQKIKVESCYKLIEEVNRDKAYKPEAEMVAATVVIEDGVMDDNTNQTDKPVFGSIVAADHDQDASSSNEM